MIKLHIQFSLKKSIENNLCTSEILNTAHLTPFFNKQYPFSISTCQNKYKWLLCTKKLVVNASFQEVQI